ncbi:hypothetical protein [Nonomuraea dietziae]|uniref:hypothetical protein n=1 Tax=Nonomuraea dietziae TaxID=65515 RepID=UPI0033E260E2
MRGAVAGLPGVPALGHGRGSDVLGVDERLLAVPGRQPYLTAEDGSVQEVVLAEVLEEPARPQHGPLQARLTQRPLPGQDVLLAKASAVRRGSQRARRGLPGEGGDVPRRLRAVEADATRYSAVVGTTLVRLAR